MDIRGLQKISLLDYPGKIAAIVWVGGCNYRCPFCYNRDLVLNPQNLPKISEEEVLGYLAGRREWIDGLEITGGEPTLQEDLPEFLKKVKELGFSTKLDTNGSNPEVLERLIRENLVDYVAMDVKAPLNQEKYSRAIGLPVESQGIIEQVKRSISILVGSNGIDYEFRTTVVPGLLDREDILLIAEELRGAKKYCLQQYKRDTPLVDETFRTITPYSIKELEEWRDTAKKNFQSCEVRGGENG